MGWRVGRGVNGVGFVFPHSDGDKLGENVVVLVVTIVVQFAFRRERRLIDGSDDRVDGGGGGGGGAGGRNLRWRFARETFIDCAFILICASQSSQIFSRASPNLFRKNIFMKVIFKKNIFGPNYFLMFGPYE